MLSRFANGEDTSPVLTTDASSQIKSVGNSVTTPRDLQDDEDARLILYALCESVAARLREHGLVGDVVELSVRDNGLFSFSCQHKLVRLFCENYHWEAPIRSMGVRVSGLSLARPEQLAFFPDEAQRVQLGMLDHTIDELRRRYGYSAIKRGLFLTDRLGELDAKSDHIIAPIGFLKGGDNT